MLKWILPFSCSISNGATYLSDLTRKLNGCVLRMASPLRHSTDANDVRRISSSCSVRARKKGSEEEYRKSIWIKTIWTFEMHETCSNEWMNTLSSRSKQAKPGRHRPRHKRKENKFEYFLEGRQGRRRRCALEQIVNICLLESLFFHGSRSLVFPSPVGGECTFVLSFQIHSLSHLCSNSSILGGSSHGFQHDPPTTTRSKGNEKQHQAWCKRKINANSLPGFLLLLSHSLSRIIKQLVFCSLFRVWTKWFTWSMHEWREWDSLTLSFPRLVVLNNYTVTGTQRIISSFNIEPSGAHLFETKSEMEKFKFFFSRRWDSVPLTYLCWTNGPCRRFHTRIDHQLPRRKRNQSIVVVEVNQSQRQTKTCFEKSGKFWNETKQTDKQNKVRQLYIFLRQANTICNEKKKKKGETRNFNQKTKWNIPFSLLASRFHFPLVDLSWCQTRVVRGNV